MAPPRAIAYGLCIAASLLVQGCVEYDAGAAPEAAQTPPQPPPSSPGASADRPAHAGAIPVEPP
jgi:hypothetical protein